MRDKNVDRLAQLLAPNARRDQPERPLIMRQATVVGISPPWNVTVLFGGSTTPAGPIPCIASYSPVVGDVVQVLVASSASMLILGPPAPNAWQQTGAGIWIAVTTNPTGWTALSRWIQRGKTLTFNAAFTFGSNFGSGNYIFNLGIPSVVPVATIPQVVSGYYDAKGDGSIRTVVAGIVSSATVGVEISRTVANATNIGVGSTAAAWAAGGSFHFSGTIEVV